METSEDKIYEETESNNTATKTIKNDEKTIEEGNEGTEEDGEIGTEEDQESTNGTIEYIVSVDSNNTFNTPINDLPFSAVMLVIGVFVIALTLIGGFKHE